MQVARVIRGSAKVVMRWSDEDVASKSAIMVACQAQEASENRCEVASDNLPV